MLMSGTLFDRAPDGAHNGRHLDIERTARELTSAQIWRADFYRMHASSKASKKQLIDAYSIIDPDISDAEYRLQRLRLYYCNEACDNYWGSTELEAALLNRTTSAIERASKGLERTEEVDNYQVSRRRRNQSSVRSFNVPSSRIEAAKELLALLEPANTLVQETAEMRVETPEPANLQSRTRKNAQLTLVNNSKEYIGATEHKSAKRKRPSIPLPEGWHPNGTTQAFVLGPKVRATQDTIEFEIERFRNHAAQNARETADWDAAFRNWMLSWRKRENEKPNTGQMNGYRGVRL
jgi:hypothetical protein